MKILSRLTIFFNSFLNSNQPTEQNEVADIQGIYNIDSSKENIHIFKHFKLDLRIENNTIKLYFVSSEEFVYSQNWKKGDLYAYTEKFDSINDTLKLNLYENRGKNKVLTEYEILISDKSFQIISIGGKRKHIDNYIKLDKTQSLSYSSIKFRDVTEEELKKLDFEYQAGIELIYWLSDLKKDSIDNKDLFDRIIRSLDSINNGIKLPIAEYNNYRDLTLLLGFTLGEILHKNYGWKWKFKEAYDNDYLGFVIVSPNNLTALKAEHYFYDNVMYKRDIKLNEFIEKLKNNDIETDNFSFYEPWMKK